MFLQLEDDLSLWVFVSLECNSLEPLIHTARLPSWPQKVNAF